MTGAPRRRLPDVFRLAVVVVTILVAAIGAVWATLTPGFRAPDEPHHVNTILRLADGGGWPEPGDGIFLQGTFVAADEAGWVTTGNELIRQNSHAHPGAWWGTSQVPFVLLVPDPVDADDRTVILELDHRVNLFEQVDQMTQHPPGYYALAAGYLKVLGAEDWRWDGQLLALRLLDVLLVAGVVPLTVVTVRRLGGSRSAALIGAFGLTAPSQLLYINGAVTNDAALNLAGAGVLAMSAVVLTSRWDWRHVVGTGAVLGAGLMVKGFMLAFIPVVALAFLLSTGTRHALSRRAWAAFLSLGVAFVVGGWWWLKNLVVYGTFQPSGYPPRPAVEDPSVLNLGDFVVGAWRNLVISSWGNYGWLETPWPEWLQHVLTYLTLAIVVVGVVLAGRHRRALLVLLASGAGVLTVILFGAWQEYHRSGVFAGLQGRYLFVAIVGILAAVAIAVDRTTARLTRTGGTAARTGVVVAFLGLAAYGLWYGFTAFYVEFYETFGRGVSRWNDWSHVGIPKMVVLVLGTCAVAVVAVALVALQSWRDLAPVAGSSSAGETRAAGSSGSSAAQAGADLPADAPEDLARAGVAADATGGADEPADPTADERRGDA